MSVKPMALTLPLQFLHHNPVRLHITSKIKAMISNLAISHLLVHFLRLEILFPHA